LKIPKNPPKKGLARGFTWLAKQKKIRGEEGKRDVKKKRKPSGIERKEGKGKINL
jgi:hypothetical protein